MTSHNPYFNRWFSAIRFYKINSILWCGHNPYFNRWFSAIRIFKRYGRGVSHNPYFNRWFSAIKTKLELAP